MYGVEQVETGKKVKSSSPLMRAGPEHHEELEKQEEIHPWAEPVSNGTLDIRGNIADKRRTGGWRGAPFIIMNEAAERLAYYSVHINMMTYLTSVMHLAIPHAATIVNNWSGASYCLTLLGAFMADAFLGRFKTIIISSCFYTVGLVTLTLTASMEVLHPPFCLPGKAICTQPNGLQLTILYCALGLVAFGTGGIKPCVPTFGGDQFDVNDEKEATMKSSFFNWFYFTVQIGALISLTVVVHVQQEKGWKVGLGIPTVSMFISVFVIAAGAKLYRYQKPMGSAFTRFFQVVVASVRNHMKGVKWGSTTQLYEVLTEESDIVGAQKLPHSKQFRFLDKAAVITDHTASRPNRWEVCTVTQVEELKSLLRILPVWLANLALIVSFAQLPTFFLRQATIMDRKITSKITMPPASAALMTILSALVVVPIYEGLLAPILRRFTGHENGLSALQRMGLGLFISIFAMLSAAVVEKIRREEHPEQDSMSVFWLFPQYFLLGTAEVFAYVAGMEFFYDESTDGTRSISSAIFLFAIGLGHWVASALMKIVAMSTGGLEKGWLRSDLNESRLDHYYWLLTIINIVNFFVYVWIAMHYKGADELRSSFRRDSKAEDDRARSQSRR